MKTLIWGALFCMCLLLPAAASAENMARDYIPAPPGTLAILTYYTHQTADSLYSQGRETNRNVDFSANVGLFRPVYYTQLGPFTIDPQFIIPFIDEKLDFNNGTSYSASGIGDPIVFATIWLYNNKESKTWFGFTPFFFLPIGNYHKENALNAGSNVWTFREEGCFVKGFEVIPGHNIYFEFTLGADFYTKNTDTNTTRNALLNVEHHTSYDVTDKFFLSADYYYHNGGESFTYGLSNLDSASNHAVGGTIGYSFAPGFQLMLQYKNDVDVESGPKSQSVTLRLLYATDFGSLIGKGK